MIYIASDHRGFEYKEALKLWLKENNIDFEDLGATEMVQDDDYPDFASVVARRVQEDLSANKGIVLCNNGVGVDIVSNKFKSIRCALGWNSEQVRLARNDDDVNILAIPAGFLPFDEITHLVDVFLSTGFSAEERFIRRLDKISNIENET